MIILFSRSGSVAYKVLKARKINPKDVLLISNNQQGERIYSPLVNEYSSSLILLKSHSEVEKMLQSMKREKILLMGYLRILSSKICERHEIYNLHPADIISYPELKGKDPIERVFEVRERDCEAYPKLGCVIHKATAEVDEGPIIVLENYTAETYQQAIEKSSKLAVKMWEKLLETL